MFEHITMRQIMERMLARVTEVNPNIDTRQGSVVWFGLSPAAVEMMIMYTQADAVLNDTFADTARRPYLIKRAAERGLSPYVATKAVWQGEFTPTTLEIPINSRFNLNALSCVITERISAGKYKLECETPGSIGNEHSGTLVPAQFISGLETATLTGLLVPGEDEEDTEAFRRRYFNNINNQAFGGNVADYTEKAMALAGVGGVKVYPVWQGGGTVRLAIIGSDYSPPSSELVDYVQTAFDPVTNHGEGLGLAPIGHTVTVEGVENTTINISVSLTYAAGWSWAAVEPSVHNAIDLYFNEMAQSWMDDPELLIVRISQIESRLLDLAGIIDITGTTINGAAVNYVMGADRIPTRGTVVGT